MQFVASSLLFGIFLMKNLVEFSLASFGTLTLFRMGFFGGCSRMGGCKKATLPKICPTFSAMMKLGKIIPFLKKIPKIYELRDTSHESCWHQQFFTRNQKFYYIKKYMYRLRFDTKFLIILTFHCLIKKLQFWWCQQKWLPQVFLK